MRASPPAPGRGAAPLSERAAPRYTPAQTMRGPFPRR